MFSLGKLFCSLRGTLLKILKETQEGKLIQIILKENNIVKIIPNIKVSLSGQSFLG